MWKYSVVALVAALLYGWRNYSQKYLLVLMQVDGGNEDRLKEINNVQAVFKVHKNMDSHMFIGTDGELDQEKMADRLKWNYVLVTTSFSNEQSSLKFGDNLRRYNFIQNFSIYPFTTNHLLIKYMNAMFIVKGFLGQLFPLMQQSFTKVDSIDEDDPLETICTDEELASEEPDVMVNIIKFKNQEVFSKYNGKVVMQMFPALDTSIFAGGFPKSDYWEQIGLIVYKNRASLCKMALSKEFREVLPYKQQGLEDTHTYLTTRIL